MESAAMFLSELSVVDHAWIDEKGFVRGGSFNPGFLVSGPIDAIEKVVVDFSTVKKTLKGLLDHDQTGFDHKLWLIEGVSQNCTFIVYESYPAQGQQDDWQTPDARLKDKRRIRISCTGGELDLPLDSVKLILNPYDENYSIEGAGRWMQEDLNARIDQRHPGVTLECRNSTAMSPFPASNNTGEIILEPFRYVHGLKDSTSWGCQNIAHGHLSFVQLVPETRSGSNTESLQKLASDIALALNDTIFVRSENLRREDNTGTEISYTCPRGSFRFDIASENRIVRLETETTIEYLVDYVRQRWQKPLRQHGCRWLFVSEGLTKGAAVDLTQRDGPAP